MDEGSAFDLDSYIGNYRGQMKIMRLLHIARTAPSDRLRADALRVAYSDVKKNSTNVQLFCRVVQQAADMKISGCEVDDQWVRTVRLTSYISRNEEVGKRSGNQNLNAHFPNI
jgi:hypothetical protein